MGRGENKRSRIVLCTVLVLPVVWAALLAAPYLSDGLFGILAGLSESLKQPFRIIIVEDTVRSVLIFLLIYVLSVGIYLSSTRNYRRKEEHGSASWGGVPELNAKYCDKKQPFDNLLLTRNVSIGLDSHVHQRNLNVLVCGGSGAGKTRGYAKPNIMQANTSYVVLDPKGEILRDTGHLLREKGYEIRVLDLINQERSHGYNPFTYLRDDADVMKLVTNLIKNTTPKGSNTNDPFWERSETALLEALIFFLMHFAPENEQNFEMIMEMIEAAEIREDDEDYMSPLDILFERRAMVDPSNIAVKQYSVYKQAAGKTAKSILVSLAVRLERFNLSTLACITRYDELEMATIGEHKVALFALIPDNDTSFNFIIGMLYTQLFQQLYDVADNKYDGPLPVPVHFLMDEFANVSLPDDFEKILSTCRSRRVSCSIIVQNLAQIKALYEKQWESIIGNCDEFLYLGGNEQSTHKYISELLGKETIDTNSYNLTHGARGNYSTNYQITGRELLTPEEVRQIHNRFALLFIRGERAVKDLKYDLKKHPNIRRTKDGGAPAYRHGATEREVDWQKRQLHPNGDYVLLADDELEQIYMVR